MLKGRFLLWALPIVTAAGAFLLGGCSTPESRISENRGLYNTLPARQQQLVAQGQIAPGMSRNAVWLAWGNPGQKVNGYARGNPTETWIYFATTTAYGYGGYGYGPYGYGPWGYPGYWGGGVAVFRSHHGRRFAVFGDPFYDPFFYSYIPPTVEYPYKTVTFVNGRVVEFQHMVGPYR